MKKISYSLYLGLVGSDKQGENSGKEIFIDFLKEKAVEYNISTKNDEINDSYEFLVIFEQIPITLRIFLVEDLKEMILLHDKIKKLDILVLTSNLSDSNFFNELENQSFEEFENLYKFRGTSILAGIDVESIFGGNHEDFHINRTDLVKKAKELNILYCFEIQNKSTDISEFFNKILDDFIFKFRESSPELFEKATSYGKEISKKKQTIRERF